MKAWSHTPFTPANQHTFTPESLYSAHCTHKIPAYLYSQANEREFTQKFIE